MLYNTDGSEMAYHELKAKCNLCSLITSGCLQSALDYIQEVQGTCDVDTDNFAVFRTVRCYSQYLMDLSQNRDTCFSELWKNCKTEQDDTRNKVTTILKTLFKLGHAANKSCNTETPLMVAVGTHDEEIIKLLLENGADPNLYDNRDEMNALALAIILNEVPVIKLLLSYGAKINNACCRSMTPLQLSVNKSSEVAKLLLQNGANIHQVLQSNSDAINLSKPPLIYAIDTNNLYLASILLEHGEDINQCYGECSNSPIHLATMKGSEDMVKLLIQFGANLNKRNGRGDTPLGLALHQKTIGRNICEALLSAGCSWRKGSMINVFQKLYPPFHIAAFLGHDFHLQFLETLLNRSKESAGEKTDTTNVIGISRMKAKHNLSISERVVDLTMSEGQELVNLQAVDKSTALFMSILGGSLNIAEFLLQKGADPEITCCYGNLIHGAVMASNKAEEVLNFAFRFNLHIDMFNDDGNTPLILSARNSNPNICEMLIKHDASLNMKDRRFGETALSASVYFGCEANAEKLICHGANPDIPDVRYDFC